jgi:2-dehydropantoate 2-reductase
MMLRIYTEVTDTAHAYGVKIEPAVIDYRQFYLQPGQDVTVQKQLVADLAIPYGVAKPSLVQSLERGRPTEIAFLNGYVVERAHAVGVDVPVNTAITQMIGEIEAGTRPMTPANLDVLAARV